MERTKENRKNHKSPKTQKLKWKKIKETKRKKPRTQNLKWKKIEKSSKNEQKLKTRAKTKENQKKKWKP